MSIAQRLLHPRARASEHRVVCPTDRFAFTPAFTDGLCPLCGWAPDGEAAAKPGSARIDRFWLALGALVASSIAMGVLVVLAYARA